MPSENVAPAVTYGAIQIHLTNARGRAFLLLLCYRTATFNFIYIVTLDFNFSYPSFILHVMEIVNVIALCNSEKLEPHIEQSVCLLQQITARIIRARVSLPPALPTLFVLNFDRG